MGAWEAKAEAERLVGVMFYPPGYPPERQLEKARQHNSRHIAMIEAYGRAAYAAGREAGLAEAARIAREARPCCTRPMYCHGAVAAAIEAVRGDPRETTEARLRREGKDVGDPRHYGVPHPDDEDGPP